MASNDNLLSAFDNGAPRIPSFPQRGISPSNMSKTHPRMRLCSQHPHLTSLIWIVLSAFIAFDPTFQASSPPPGTQFARNAMKALEEEIKSQTIDI